MTPSDRDRIRAALESIDYWWQLSTGALSEKLAALLLLDHPSVIHEAQPDGLFHPELMPAPPADGEYEAMARRHDDVASSAVGARGQFHRDAAALLRRQTAAAAEMQDALTLIRERAKRTSADRWIEDSAAIHSLAFCALAPAPETVGEERK